MTGDDTHFIQRLLAIESDLLNLNRSSLVDFHQRWTLLVDDLQIAIEARRLAPSTVTTAHALAARVSKMIQTFLDLEILSEQLMASLLEETSSVDNSSVSLNHKLSNHSTPSPLPPYLKLSYDWLSKNIHNPYPSQQVRDAITQKSGSARKDVDNWFIDARKRIGWNNARKIHFSNKRVEIVDAATRFYANDEKLSLSLGAEHALISIMNNAKELYSDKFGETILASRLASAVKDLTAETKADAKAERLRQTLLTKDRDSYPSPDGSPEPSYPSFFPCDDEVDNISTQPTSISTTSRKRRNVSAEPLASNQDQESSQAKRPRLEALNPSPEGVAFPTGLPSPAPSVEEPLHATEPTESPSLPSSTSTPASRKRRSSESDCQSVSKRPRPLPVGSRLRSVTDTSPLSNHLSFDETSFDDWFQQIFDSPEVGEISPLGFSVELGSLSDFDYTTPSKSCPTSPGFLEQNLDHRTVNNIPTVLDMPWNEFNFSCTDTLSLSSDNLGQSNSLTNSVGQESVPKPLAQDFVNFHNELESFFGFSNPSTVELPLNPPSDETWNFSGSAVSRDDANSFGKHNADFSSNSDLLASFDLSQDANFLPSRNAISWPTLPNDKARQEKEKEFREAYEKAQTLALELQRDGLFVA